MRRVISITLALAVLALLSSAVRAIDGLGLSAHNVEGFGLRIGTVELSVSGLESDAQSLRIDLRDLSLPAPVSGLGSAHVDCATARIEADAIHCKDAAVRLAWAVLDRPGFRADFDVRLDGGDIRVAARGLRVAGGRVDLRLHRVGDDVDVRLVARDIDVAGAMTLAKRFGVPVEGWSVASGKAELTLNARLHRQVPQRADWKLALRELSGGNDAGTIASDGAALDSSARVRWRAGRPGIDARLNLTRGQFYVDPVFVELKDAPIGLGLNARQTKTGWQLQKATFDDAGHLRLRAEGELDTDGAPVDLKLDISELALGPSYARYAQPMLLDGLLADLDITGNASGSMRIDADGLAALHLDLPRVDMDDRQGRIGVYGLGADIDWQRGDARESGLHWNSAHLFALDMGAVDWRLLADARSVELVSPAVLPILDGELDIDALAVHGLGAQPKGHFEGFLKPVSMRALSHAFGWPSMEGKLSGVIPGITYADGRVLVDGVLLMRVFDGDITLRDVEIDDPFGIAPALRGNMSLRNLDLESLTRTFAFGEITGRLRGWVRNLRMVDWQPIEFDAGFVTPEDDDSRHRISQKAVDNLTSLGGVSGALSRTFMRFFETFSYDRLGLTCRLRNNVCEMGGVLPAGEDGRSYYIVKGGGLPRIDVVGFAQRVDWPTLLERIQRITAGGGPEIR